MEQATCQDCGTTWERLRQRGRRPKRCDSCRVAERDRYNASRRSDQRLLNGRTCANCGETFDATTASQNYCDADCRSEAATLRRRRSDRRFRCENCGNLAVAGEGETHIFARRFCRPKCKTAWHRDERPGNLYVGPSCRIHRAERRTWIEGRCPECGRRFVRQDNHDSAVGYCQRACQKRVAARRRRAYLRGAGYKTLTYLSVAERDEWRCQLCGEPVDRTANAPQPMAPTLDHIVPLSRGGSHTLENCQVAHFICNSRKSDGAAVSVGGQLSLV